MLSYQYQHQRVIWTDVVGIVHVIVVMNTIEEKKSINQFCL